ncbi:peroxiredoxin [Phanerochaete sordida]|uniref:Peroxiredoxin n=1 Tax=Phanerochaete sordida TaxID=48140 RepID=A0A9P3LFZ2_9APHY|nr:peroxiredoxin [Phanerochaete sordida]
MASVLSSVTNAAHSAAVSLLASAQITAGSDLPIKVPVKEEAADQETTFASLEGKNVIIGVPGAFTGTCTRQIPGYAELYDQFKAKGVKDIYVVAVNDFFVMKAWKDSFGPSAGRLRFIADDKGAFVGALGMLFDASARLGSPRSKRFALITEGTNVQHVIVEQVPSELTVTAADKVLAFV